MDVGCKPIATGRPLATCSADEEGDMAEPRSQVGISNREAPEEEARDRQKNPPELEGETQPQDERPATHDWQSSTKSGTKASAQKRDTTRHTEDTAPAAAKVQGAFGKESE
jgi:hypothetical protein